MADNSDMVANMARILAIVHSIVGFLLFCFGIVNLLVGYSLISCGIWMGVWMFIAGGLGMPGTRKERSTYRNVFASIFMGFSITSAVFGGIIIISYSLAIAHMPSYGYNIDGEMALCVIILILGIVEHAIGIWAAVCLCMMKPCTCCYGNPAQQMGHPSGQEMCPVNSGHAMTQYPGYVPVAVPMQAGSGMVPVQGVTPGPQGSQPQMIVVPVSGMVGNQPQFVQIATSGAITTGYQPQFAQVATSGAMATVHQPQVKPTYGQGGYMKMENEQL